MHEDVQFAVDDASGKERIFDDFDKAAGFALAISASWKGAVHLDVLITSHEGADAWGGNDAVNSYLEDPDASVSDRIIITAESVGRVP